MESINLRKLDEAFFQRLQDENLSKKQNEIRSQVVIDPRITYDQYCNLLKGAHLKPIDKHMRNGEQGFRRSVSYTNFEDNASRPK